MSFVPATHASQVPGVDDVTVHDELIALDVADEVGGLGSFAVGHAQVDIRDEDRAGTQLGLLPCRIGRQVGGFFSRGAHGFGWEVAVLAEVMAVRSSASNSLMTRCQPKSLAACLAAARSFGSDQLAAAC